MKIPCFSSGRILLRIWLSCAIVLALMVSLKAATFTSIANGNWSSPTTWAGGVAPGSTIAVTDTVNIGHIVTYNNANDLEVFGVVNIINGTFRTALTGSGENRSVFIRPGGEWNMCNAKMILPIFSCGYECFTGANKSGNFSNNGGSIIINNSTVHIAQNWEDVSNPGAGTRTFNGGCLIVGENFTNKGSQDLYDGICAEMGWHGSTNLKNEYRMTFQDGNIIRLVGSGSVENVASSPHGVFGGPGTPDIAILYISNGNMVNNAAWSASVLNFCINGGSVSGSMAADFTNDVTNNDTPAACTAAQDTTCTNCPQAVCILEATAEIISEVTCEGNDGIVTVNITEGTETPVCGTDTTIFLWNTVPPQTTQTIDSLPPGTYTVTVTDGAGCTDTASVTLLAPANCCNLTVICPADAIYDCVEDVPLPDTSLVIVTDTCGDFTITIADDTTGTGCGVDTMFITRTYFIEDSLNFDTCTQVLIVIDDEGPIITCPANVTVECGSSTLPASTGSATATDNCDTLVTIFSSDLITPGECPQEFTVFRTWTATDDCGNTSTCLQTISVVDTTPPVITCPPNVTIDCTASTLPSNTGTATATDCDPTPTIIPADITVAGICPQEYTILRTWSATDDCGNTSTCLQTITVNDSSAPTITCPPNVTVQCATQVPPPNVEDVTATDDCGPADITFVSDVTVNFTCVNRFTVNRTYRATDACGNSATCIQTITVFDNTPPTLTCPQNITVTCASNVPPADPGSIITSDNCGGVVTVTSADVITSMTCLNRFTVVRTYTATDACGNAGTCAQLITVFDNIPPTITCPPNVTVQCANLVPPANPGSVITSDNCAGAVTVTAAPDVISNMTCANRFTITRVYTATDACGNTATCAQTITVFDNTAPTITCPANVTVSCASQVPPVSPGTVTSSDNCGGTNTVTFVSDVTSNMTCPNRFTLTRTYRATDACGNSATCAQVITVNDITPPVITCPPNITIDIEDSTDPSNTGNPTGSDNCGGTPLFTSADVTIAGECPEEYIIFRTWTATDACGNSSTCLQTIDLTGGCIVDLTLIKTLNAGQGSIEGGDNVTFTITVTNEGEVEIGSITITDYIPLGFTLNDPDWTPGNEGSTGQSASIVLSVANGELPPGGLLPGQSVSVEITLQADENILAGEYINVAEISFVFDIDGNDVSGDDIDSDPDEDDLNDPEAEDDHDLVAFCISPQPVILGDNFVCPGDTVTYSVASFNPANTYTWILQNGGGIIIDETDSTITIVWQMEPGGAFVIQLTESAGVGCSATTLLLVFIQGDDVLACNDHVNVSIDEDCESVILSGIILEGEQFGDDNYVVIIIDQNGDTIPNATVTIEHVGQTFVVKVMSECSGNSCWGTITVEDKLPPQIVCTCPVEGVEITNFAGILDANTPVFTRPNTMPQGGTCTEGNSGVPYLAFPFYVDMSGGSQFDVVTFTAPSGDSFLALYQDSFDPSEPCQNLVAADDDAGPNFLSQIIATLEADRTYILVVTTFDNDGDDFGDFNVTVSSSGNVFLIDPACQVTCLEIDQLIEGIIPVDLQPVVTDNCGIPTIEILNTDLNFDNCEGGFILVTWLATDVAGNTATCVQEFTIVPLTLDSLVFPANYIGECGGSTEPDVTGWPQINGINLTAGGVCNIFTGYWDKELAECGGGRKIVRTWTVLDWCLAEVVEGTQIIKLTDAEGPELTCPPNITVGTDFWYCFANVSVPKPIAHDNCSDVESFVLSASSGDIISFGNNFVINGLLLGTHTVIWTVTDECGNSSTCSFTITVEDDVVPVALCDEHTIVSLTNDGPFGVTLVPADVFDDGSYDACGPVTFRARRMDSCIDFDWTTEGACIDHIPGGIPPVNSRDRGTVHRPCVPFACCDVGAGPIMVELEVTDAAGNVNFCMVEVEVQDKISPFIICPPDIIISCEFWFAVEEGTFSDGEGNNNGSLDEDPLSRVFGNMFDAFRFTEDVRDDIIINDPDNDQFIQPHNWGLDGWADDNCEVILQVRVRIFDDCSGDALPGNAPPGAVRLIERRFSAIGGADGTPPGTCVQRIWVVDFEPFFISDNNCNNSNPNDGVIWPCDVTLTTCPEDLSGTGEPIVFDDACSLIGVAFEDTRFDFVDGSCFKILRKWSVIDWCQYNPLTGEGLWMFTQVIKVNDHEGPEFLDCPAGPIVLCVADPGVTLPDNNQAFLGEENPLSSSCSAHLNLCKTVHETCSDFVKFDVKIYPFNGNEFIQVKPRTTVPVDSNNNAVLCFDTRESTIQSIRLSGIPYNSPWCGNYHRILWSVEDDCGNFSFCEYLFRLEDCKQPSPVCINGLSTVVMPIGGQVTIWASDFDASSFDDCTPAEELLFSFSGDTYEPSFTYTCDNVPAFGVELAVQIWVADFGTDDNCNGQISWDERNKDFCTTTIVIMDNEEVCDHGDPGVLEGEILSSHTHAVSNVTVNLSSPGLTFVDQITGSDGKYSFGDLPLGKDYVITVSRNDEHKNGVSTLDLVRIQKHLLGRELFTDPYQYIAADANNNNHVSAIDLIELRKLILGIYTELPFNSSWRFVDKKFSMPDEENPWPFREFIAIEDLSESILDNDFIAMKVGDVNNTAKANALQILPRGDRRTLTLSVGPQHVEQGEIVTLRLRVPEALTGFQWTIEAEGLQLENVSSENIHIGDWNVGLLKEGVVTMSWNQEQNENMHEGFTIDLVWKAKRGGDIADMIKLSGLVTEAEAYTPSGEILDVKLAFEGGDDKPEFALYQNTPNPWKDNTVIGFELPAKADATLTVYDVTGKTLKVVEGTYSAGYNTISLASNTLPSSGVLYYRLESGEYSATKKMMIIR